MLKPFFSIALILLAGLTYFVGIKPMSVQVKAVVAERDLKAKTLADGKKIAEDEKELKTKAASLTEEQEDSLNSFLPNKSDIVKRALDLETLATKYGLTLTGKVDGKEQAQAQAQAPTGPGAFGVAQQNYSTFTITFKMTGSYESFKKFLADLSKNRVISDVESLSFAPSLAASGSFDFDLSIKTYWLPTGAGGAITTP